MLEDKTMTRGWRIYLIDAMAVIGIVGCVAYGVIAREPDRRVETSDFARTVNLEPLYRIAVQADGRLRSFESHSKTYMGFVSGPRRIHGQANAFTYLDLMFRSQLYNDIDIIYVKNKQVRDQILASLEGHPAVDDNRAAAIRKSGLFSRHLLTQPQVSTLLEKLGLDLIKTEKVVRSIESALTVSDPRFLSSHLKVIAPPSGQADQPWHAIDEITSPSGMPQDSTHASMTSSVNIEGLAIETQQRLASSWSNLRRAWISQDAEKSSAAVLALSEMLPTIAPALYPSGDRLAWESWYFRTKSMSWVWLVYLLSVIPLLMAIIYKWQGARTIGMLLFMVAFALQTASIALRWYISGRWPNANMYEAVTTSAWSGGVAAIILERIARKTNFRNIFALGSAVVSMIALMAAYFLPTQLDSGISNKMAALNDVWLYIHTNVIIWSYAVIGLACIPSLLFLRHRWCYLWDQALIPKFRMLLLPIVMLVANITGGMLLMHFIAYTAYGLPRNMLLATSVTFWLSMTTLGLELMSARSRRAAGVRVDRAASGGASAIMAATPSSDPFIQAERPTSSQVYDGATMVLVELSFVMLWTGVVMGAIWADHSWGRPWGWDPKEVFALNTFIIFLILIHVRMKVKDKGFWTAIIALIGFEVMMFNWIVVNFIITGLHSYA